MVGLLDVIESKMVGSSSKLVEETIEETRVFHGREKGFGRQLAFTNIMTTRLGMTKKIIFNCYFLNAFELIQF